LKTEKLNDNIFIGRSFGHGKESSHILQKVVGRTQLQQNIS
jgi:hypothetical protein